MKSGRSSGKKAPEPDARAEQDIGRWNSDSEEREEWKFKDQEEKIVCASEDVDSLVDQTFLKLNHLWESEDKTLFSDISKQFLEANTKKTLKKDDNLLLVSQKQSDLYNHANPIVAKEDAKSQHQPKTLGKGWFNMAPLEIDEKLKRDLRVIQMRNYLDPKRFYKNPDKGSKVLHVGTVVEGPSEYFSSRLSKKERKNSLVDEVFAEAKIKNYTKRVFLDIQKEKSNKRKIYATKKDSRKKSKKSKQ